jgi:hypothetical protein
MRHLTPKHKEAWLRGYQDGLKPRLEEPRKVIPPTDLTSDEAWDYTSGFIAGDRLAPKKAP